MKIYTLLITLLLINNSYAQSNIEALLTSPDEVVSAKKFEMSSYEDSEQLVKRSFTKAQYQRVKDMYKKRFKHRSFEIEYLSDNLKVKAIIITPPKFNSKKKYPIIIYNRGGNREFGKTFTTNKLASHYADKGYIVLTSQYRGVDGGEGKEEFGGRDITDVMTLLRISKEYTFSDERNAFLIGASRGGMMTYLALMNGAQVNAAVSLYAPSDLFLMVRNRPRMEEMVLKQLIPNFLLNREEELRKRSALHWPREISKPLLLLHGDADRRVSHEHSKQLAEKLKGLNSKVRLKIYPNQKHGLRGVTEDVLEETHQWLDKYKLK